MDEGKETDKTKIGGRVPIDLWDKVQAIGYKSQTDAIILGLELILKTHDVGQEGTKADEQGTKADEQGTKRDNQGTAGGIQGTIADRIKITELMVRNEELERHITLLEKSLEKAEKDTTSQVEFYKGQIATKDLQIDKHTFSIQSLIQENNRLNLKMLPESTEVKKPWWKFW